MAHRRLLFVLVIGVCCTGSSVARAQTGQFLVAGHDDALPSAADVAAAGGTWVGEIPSIGVAIVKSDAPNFLAAIKKRRSVALAAQDVELSIPEAPAESTMAAGSEELSSSPEGSSLSSVVASPDALSVLEWDDVVLGTKATHDRGITGEGVTIAIVDSGIDITHPDLAAAVIPEGKSFVVGDASPFPTTGSPTSHGHGTAVSGVIGAACNNGIGVCGIAPGAKLLSVRVSDGTSTPMSALLLGYDWASTEGVARHDVRIISSSHAYSCLDTDLLCRERVIDLMGIGNRMVAAVFRRGVLLVVAAGNGNASGIAYDMSAQGDSLKLWPGGKKALTVGSTGPCCAGCDGDPMNDDDYDDPAIYSNFGFSELDSSFMVMPGGQRNACPKPNQCTVTTLAPPLTRNCGQFDMVWTTTFLSSLPGVTQTRYFALSGTSAAVPQAAGLAALMLSRFPHLKPGQLKEILLHDLTVDLGAPGYDPLFGHGRGSAALIP